MLMIFSYTITMMMTLYKKSVHSFLGFTSSIDIPITPQPSPPTTASSSLGLASATAIDACRLPNVVESAAVKSTTPALSSMIKKDPGGIGFIDDIGGGVNGLMSCTESLGFESSDERRVDDDEMSVVKKDDHDVRMKPMRRRMSEKKTVKNYPPPIPSLNQNGQPSFFLRPVRKDGRLELTEVRIYRQEILRASREDGRLKLHFVAEEDDECEEEDNDNEDVMVENNDEDVEELVIFPGSNGGGDGFWRCNEAAVSHHNHHHGSHHHHQHNMHAWSHHCVPTR